MICDSKTAFMFGDLFACFDTIIAKNAVFG